MKGIRYAPGTYVVVHHDKDSDLWPEIRLTGYSTPTQMLFVLDVIAGITDLIYTYVVHT